MALIEVQQRNQRLNPLALLGLATLGAERQSDFFIDRRQLAKDISGDRRKSILTKALTLAVS